MYDSFISQSKKRYCIFPGFLVDALANWFIGSCRVKDGKEIVGGINGQLHIGNLQDSHSGLYSCRVETIAGISTSKQATLEIRRKYYFTEKTPSKC